MTVKGCSEMVFFREWSKQVLDSLWFAEWSIYGDHLFPSECLKFDVDSRNARTKSKKMFLFER